MSEFGILGVWGQKQEGLLASLAILLGVLNKEKALQRWRVAMGFFICSSPQASLGLFQIKKPCRFTARLFRCRQEV